MTLEDAELSATLILLTLGVCAWAAVCIGEDYGIKVKVKILFKIVSIVTVTTAGIIGFVRGVSWLLMLVFA